MPMNTIILPFSGDSSYKYIKIHAIRNGTKHVKLKLAFSSYKMPMNTIILPFSWDSSYKYIKIYEIRNGARMIFEITFIKENNTKFKLEEHVKCEYFLDL